MRRTSAVGVVLATGMLASACGSTVAAPGALGSVADPAGQAHGELGTNDGLGGAAAVPGGPPPAPQAGAPGMTPSEAAGVASAANRPAAPVPKNSHGAADASSTQQAPGVTATSVHIGYVNQKGTAQAAKSFGISGTDTGDIKAQVLAMVKDANSRGGLLGRTIVPVEYAFEIPVSNPAETAQEACDRFTQDNRVLAVVDPTALSGISGDVLFQCLNKRSTVLLGTGLFAEETFSRYPLVIAPAWAATEPYMRTVVARLDEAGYFDGWNVASGKPGGAKVKVGLMGLNDRNDTARVNALQRSLNTLGYEVETVMYDPSNQAAVTSGAVLRFKAGGVTHVFDPSIIFVQEAATQGYRPRYGITDALQTPAAVAQNYPAAQLQGALGVGFTPTDEASAVTSTGPAGDRCRRIMQQAGQDTSSSFARRFMFNVCDAFTTLKAAVEMSNQLTPRGVTTGYALMTRPMSSAYTYSVSYSAARRWGATHVRDFVYVTSCTCFEHAGPTHPIAP